MILRTPRLELVPAPSNFIKALIQNQRAQAEQFLDVTLVPDWPGGPMTEHGLPHDLEAIENDQEEMLWRIRLMILRAERLGIGSINLKGKPDAQGRVGIGWGLDPAYQGSGYATEAARAVVQWVFINRAVSMIWARIQDDNHQSIRLAQRFGMLPGERESATMTVWHLTRETFQLQYQLSS